MRKNHILVNKHCIKSTFYTMSEPGGVTLIALIVTIIVLLILAGVTLANITGGNSTIDKASEAKLSTDVKTELEELQSRINNSATKGIRHGNFSGSVDASSIKAALTNLVTDTSGITGNGPWQVTGSKTNTNYLIKQDFEIIPMPENTGTRTEMNVQVGDFVNYDAGTWTQDEIDSLGELYSGKTNPDSTKAYTFGGFEAGQSRNTCITPYSSYKNKYDKGWRILRINTDNSIDIIHAGTPEGYFHPNEDYAAHKSMYILDKTYNNIDIDAQRRNWTMYENVMYSIKDSAHLIKINDLNDIIKITGSYYWTADYPDYGKYRDFYFKDNAGRTYRNGYGYCFGIRPVVALKAECLFQDVNDKNTTTHDTQETAWNLVI